MKKIIATLALIFAASSASADYTMIVPQKVGGGTSVWAEIVAKELEKHLGEPIVIDYRPGARDSWLQRF
jgi:tripartite-type tricarboxylate transporter receptor subunit TctC